MPLPTESSHFASPNAIFFFLLVCWLVSWLVGVLMVLKIELKNSFTNWASTVPPTYICVARCGKCLVSYSGGLQGDVDSALGQSWRQRAVDQMWDVLLMVYFLFEVRISLSTLALDSLAQEALSL